MVGLPSIKTNARPKIHESRNLETIVRFCSQKKHICPCTYYMTPYDTTKTWISVQRVGQLMLGDLGISHRSWHCLSACCKVTVRQMPTWRRAWTGQSWTPPRGPEGLVGNTSWQGSWFFQDGILLNPKPLTQLEVLTTMPFPGQTSTLPGYEKKIKDELLRWKQRTKPSFGPSG